MARSRLILPRGPSLHVPKRYEAPMAPQPYVDAVEEWARKAGRHARWVWSKEMECWTINLTMPADAPVMKSYRDGNLEQSEVPTEGIPLIEQDPKTGKFRALDLEQYGPSGIVEMLEKGDTWSGRGEHRSLTEFVAKTIEANREHRENVKKQQKEIVREELKERRHKKFGAPTISVPKNIG